MLAAKHGTKNSHGGFKFRFLQLKVIAKTKQETMHVELCPSVDSDGEAVSPSSTTQKVKKRRASFFLFIFSKDVQN